MKRSLAFLAAFMMLLAAAVVGCGSESRTGGSCKTGDLTVTLDDIRWVDVSVGSVEPSWESWHFKLVAVMDVRNDGSGSQAFTHEEVYLITEEGKAYEANCFDLSASGQEFKPREKRRVAYGWYFTMYGPGARTEVDELKAMSDVSLMVQEAEFCLPELDTIDLIAVTQYTDLFGEGPPALDPFWVSY